MKRNLWLILIPVLVTGLCTAISFVAGHYVPWTPLGTPPEPAVEILTASGLAVNVRAVDGKTYRCLHGPRGTYPLSVDCEWEEIDLADFGPGAPEIDELCSYLLPPGRVVDRFYFCAGPHWRYVVLADGSVWALYEYSEVVVSPYLLLYALWPTCGPAIGLLLGIALSGLLWLRRQRAA